MTSFNTGDKMEHNLHDETKLLAVIGLLVSVLLVVSILFGVTYFSDLKHAHDEVDIKGCYIKAS
jgi:competence protein ComGC